MKSRMNPHGGKREGAGRPVGDKPARKVTSFSIDADLIERLTAHCKENGLSKSEVVNQALRKFL